MVKKMKETTFADGLGHIDGDIVDRFVEMDERLQKKSIKKKTNGSVRLSKWALVAACLCIMVVTAVSIALITRAISPMPDEGGVLGGNTDSGNTNEDTEKEQPTYNTIEVSDEVIQMCVDTLYYASAAGDGAYEPICLKIKGVATGWYNATQVSVDPDDFYFICAYFDDPYPPLNKYFPFHIKQYTWVAFDSPYDIPQYYNGIEFVRAVQINRASQCVDFLSGEDSDITVEHCQRFYPSFSNGFNTADALICEESYVYLSSCYPYPKDKKTYYYTAYTPFRENLIIPFMTVEGETYLMTFVGNEWPDGDYTDYKTPFFGEYYDYLMNVMVSEYEEHDKKTGHISFHALFEPEDIKKLMSNNVEN